MIEHFKSVLAADLMGFLKFKRNLGYGYVRAGATLQEFDRFVIKYVKENRVVRLDRAILSWLESKPDRKAISVSRDAAVLRGFCNYLKRIPGRYQDQIPRWPQLPNEAEFKAYFLSRADICQLLDLAARLDRPSYRAALYRALLLLLYCTGLRFGEALRLCISDVDTRAGVLFVKQFKGRARWVPFHRSLAAELDSYLKARRSFAPALASDLFFVGTNRKTLPKNTASQTLRYLFRKAGMKPAAGRVGPRPYDLRHAFAMHRLALWYRQGADIHARLPWLSAYMGHDNILGTQTYLSATPELLALAGNRMRNRYLNLRKVGTDHESPKTKHPVGFGSELFP
jgi:integrase/recombinase XerD